MTDQKPIRLRASAQDLTGKRFGRLTVLSLAGKRRSPCGKSELVWHCRCDCGTEKDVRGNTLRWGSTQSCGCLHRDQMTRHGRAETSEYFVWGSMLQRCYNPKHRQFRHYGGRGIRVCDRWGESFANFLAEMGKRPPGLQLDRIDNDRGYEPGNCRWATTTEQSRNRRSCRLLTLGDETMPLSAWAVRTGLPENTIRNRLRRGWSDERTLTEPVHWNP